MSTPAPKKFSFDVVLAVGAAIALINFGLFYFCYVTDLIYTLDLTGFFLLASRVVLTTLLFFVSVFWLKYKGAVISFFSIMAHFVLIGVVAAVIQTVPEGMFYEKHPTFNAEIAKVNRDRFKAIADSLDDKKVKQFAMDDIKSRDAQIEQMMKQPSTYSTVFNFNIFVYLLTALFLGLILGSLFHYIVRP